MAKTSKTPAEQESAALTAAAQPMSAASVPQPHLKCEPSLAEAASLKASGGVPTHKMDLLPYFKSLPPLPQKGGAALRMAGPVRSPQWNSVFLFFNFAASVTKPTGYTHTTTADVLNMIDEGANPSNPTIKNFLYDYWYALSYGNLRMSMEIPRSATGVPLVPTVTLEAPKEKDVVEITMAILKANPVAIWQAAGSLVKDGKRYIPSVVLVRRWSQQAWAKLAWNFGFEVDGKNYIVGDFTHIDYSNEVKDHKNGFRSRGFWMVLCHEYAHNFLEAGDLYGPGGCTGYWDILGEHEEPFQMSETCSIFKEKVGWLKFKEVISTTILAKRTLELRPYTTTGDAIKIIPDPINNPFEYFILEYRKSTDGQIHVPDGGLPYEGLLICHINERLGFWAKPWFLREAPFFDPEYADFADLGEALWQGLDTLQFDHPLYPTGTKNAFTPVTSPNSHFYGSRPSGVSITNIRVVGGKVLCELQIAGGSKVGWTVSNADRGLAGRFSNADGKSIGQEVFIRNADNVALLRHKGGQVFTKSKQTAWIDNWHLSATDREVVGDFDGDGMDEIFVRSPKWAGMFKYRTNQFRNEYIQQDKIDNWPLAADNWELVADLDGDGKDEVYVRSPKAAAVLKLRNGKFSAVSIHQDVIGEWRLGAGDKEFVGRFSQKLRDEIVVLSADWLGLLAWDAATTALKLKKIHSDRIDGWNIQAGDKISVGDFDGDGYSEIYIRSAKWAGVLKWVVDKFKLLWIVENFVPERHDVAALKVPLTANDVSYAGRFFTTKDGILHRVGNQVALLIWENGRMNVRLALESGRLNPWNLAPTDKFVLGDFHKVGIEGHQLKNRVLLPSDHITDNLSDVFIHNGWGTGILTLNYIGATPGNPDWNEWGMSWMNAQNVLMEG